MSESTNKQKFDKIMTSILNKVGGLSFIRIMIILVFFFICITIIQRCMVIEGQQLVKEKEQSIKALQDTAVVWKDKEGKTHYQIETLTAISTEALSKLESSREDVKHLQSIVAKYDKELKKVGSSVTVTKPSVIFDTVLKTDERTIEILKDSTVRNKINTKWVKADYGFSKDSTWLKFETFDKLSLLNKFERKNIFSPYIMKTELISENPNIKYEYLKGWSNTAIPEKKWIVGPALILGVDKNLNFNYLLGAGVMYKLGSF